MKKIIIESKTHGRHEVLLDDEDYDRLNEHKWCANWISNNFYVMRKSAIDSNGKNKTIQLHREITNAPKGKVVDHINGNTLDNRKENLRICTAQENQMNRRINKNNKSGYKGVHYAKKKKDMINELSKPWEVQICLNRERMSLGMYKTKEEAARVYDKKAIELFGEFAQVNFPNEHKNHIE